MIKSINKLLLIIIFIISFSCSKRSEDILYLEKDHTKFLKIDYSNNQIAINESSSSYPLKTLRLKNGKYYLGKVVDNEIDSLIFLSNEGDYRYLMYDRFSLIDDSVIIKKQSHNNFSTLIKSNKKPVLIEYFYDSNYKINKVVYNIGKEHLIYK